MRLTIAMLLATCIQVYAKEGFTQKVTLDEKDAPLEKVFKQVRRQTGYLFLYTKEVVQEVRRVDIHVRDASLEEVLGLCLKGQGLGYTILEKTIIIKHIDGVNVPVGSGPAAIVIQGVVTDSTGKPLAGVTILVKGTKIQTLSDANGNFKISVPSASSILVFSSVGFKSMEMAAGSQNLLNVVLRNNPNVLNEVVITGFGESRAKRNLGYSVTQVTGEEIRQTTAINPISALQGLVSGLQVTPGIGGPSATPRFLIRGSSSLNPYGNTPLIVVDGVILDDQSVTPNTGVGPDFGNILKDLNPDDIESMSVLKGGAVTALYGSRAANGVILIKTKKGYNQKGVGVSVSQTVMIEQAYKQVDFQNQFGWGLYQTDFITSPTGQLQVNPNDYSSFGPPMTGQTILDVTGKVRQNLPNSHDLLDLYRKGLTSNTNIAFAGGNENSSFRFSYSRLSDKAATPNNNFDRNSLSLRATHRINRRLLLDGNISYSNSNTLNPALQGGSSPLYQFAYDGARNYDVKYWSTHYIDSVNGGVNNNDPSGITSAIFFPLYEKNDFQKENNFRGGLDMTANILPWLTFQGNTSVNYYAKHREQHKRGSDPGFANPYYYGSDNSLLQLRYRGDLAASKPFGDFATGLHLGGEVTTSESSGASYNTNGAILPDVYRLSNSKNLPTITESKPNQQQISSAYFQGSVSWRDFLSLNLYGRNDWNSTLVYNDGHGSYSYFYGGADLAWVFTENFKKLPAFVNFGKLRLSYASAGNGTGSYTTNTGSYSAGTYPTLNNGSVTTYSYASSTLPNQNLVPERTNKIETGLEFGLFHNRLGGDLTFYTQQTSKQIIGFGVPAASGVSAALLNGGIVRNRGIELTIYGTPIQTKNFKWNSRFLYTLNRNKVISLPFGVDYLGLTSEDGIRTVAIKNGDYALMVAGYGYARYQATDASNKPVASPLNGQHVLGMFANNTQAYYVRASNYGTDPFTREPVLGSTLPNFLGSWKNTFTYKGFFLNVFLDAKIGGLQYSTTYFYGSQNGTIASTLYGRNKALGGVSYTPVTANSQYQGFPLGGTRDDGIMLKGVFKKGSSSVGTDGNTHDVSGMTFDDAYKAGYVTPVNAADYYVRTYSWSKGIREAGTYTSSWVSLREVSFGYELPSSVANKLKMNNLRMTLIARNPVFLYNSAPNHINPDNLTDSGSGSAFEEGGIPYMRSFGFSLNTSF